MESKVEQTPNERVAACIKAIGQDLINRAYDISRDINLVGSITIVGKIEAGEITNYDVVKNYRPLMYCEDMNPMNKEN